MGLSIRPAAMCDLGTMVLHSFPPALGRIFFLYPRVSLSLFGGARAFLGPLLLLAGCQPGADRGLRNAVTWNSSAWQAVQPLSARSPAGHLYGLGEPGLAVSGPWLRKSALRVGLSGP